MNGLCNQNLGLLLDTVIGRQTRSIARDLVILDLRIWSGWISCGNLEALPGHKGAGLFLCIGLSAGTLQAWSGPFENLGQFWPITISFQPHVSGTLFFKASAEVKPIWISGPAPDLYWPSGPLEHSIIPIVQSCRAGQWRVGGASETGSRMSLWCCSLQVDRPASHQPFRSPCSPCNAIQFRSALRTDVSSSPS